MTIISSFASSTFLLAFTAINLSAFRLRKRIGVHAVLPLLGGVGAFASWVVLAVYLFRKNVQGLEWIVGFYAAIVVVELVFSERRLIRRVV